MYLALENKGVFRSTDAGTHWIPINNGLIDKNISAVAAIGNTLFAGTNSGLYRFDLGVWQQLTVIPSEAIHSLEVMKNDLYVGTGPNLSRLKQGELNPQGIEQMVNVEGTDSKRIFRWELGDTKWKDTGLVDTGKQPNEDLNNGLKLAVSGKVVYVGKRDGKLFQSLDGGNSWRDVTSSLSFSFTRFKEIVFAGSTVYVATDKGVLSSQTGAHWRVLTDGTGERIVINRFAVDHTRVYGAGDTGVYYLDAHSKWRQVSSEVPGKVHSLAVNGDKLYVVTQQRRMFHISLEGEDYALSHK